jgi:hypothetical protein
MKVDVGHDPEVISVVPPVTEHAPIEQSRRAVTRTWSQQRITEVE